MDKSNLFERNPKKTVLAVVLLFAIFVDFSAGYFFIPKISGRPSDYYHHDLKKYFKDRVSWGSEEQFIYTDSLGFKDAGNRRVELAGDKRRIVFIGDSFVEGVGMPYQKTFIGLIDGKLDKSKFEILNAAVASYSPKLYYLKVKYLVENLGLKFDELYVYIDISDIQDEITYEDFFPIPAGSFKSIYVYADAFFKQHSVIYSGWLRENLLRLGYLVKNRGGNAAATRDQYYDDYYKTRDLWTDDERSYDAWGKKGVDLAVGNMDKLYRLCKDHGIKLTVAVYPWPHQIKARDIDSKQVAVWKKFTQDRGLAFIDYFPDFIGSSSPDSIIQKYFIKGDVHWNEAGHGLIAQGWLDRHK